MRRQTKSLLIKAIRPLALKLGFSETIPMGQRVEDNFSKHNLLHNLYRNLKLAGINPTHIVDVGANHGGWTREALIFFPQAQYSLIEPQERLRDSLEDILEAYPKVQFHAMGAGKENGTFRFTIVDRDDSCTFSLTEREALEKGFEQIEVPVTTLNDFLKVRNLPFPEIVKIDAEGLDLDVLIGSSNLFGKTEVFLVEAAIFNKRFKNNLLSVVQYMDTIGYNVFEITDLNRPWKNQVLWLVEIAFVKKGGKIDSFDFKNI